MNCANCEVNKIGPKTAHFGGYLCGNDHFQCKHCNDRSAGQCGFCKSETNFVQVKLSEAFPLTKLAMDHGGSEPVPAPSSKAEFNFSMHGAQSFTKVQAGAGVLHPDSQTRTIFIRETPPHSAVNCNEQSHCQVTKSALETEDTPRDTRGDENPNVETTASEEKFFLGGTAHPPILQDLILQPEDTPRDIQVDETPDVESTESVAKCFMGGNVLSPILQDLQPEDTPKDVQGDESLNVESTECAEKKCLLGGTVYPPILQNLTQETKMPNQGETLPVGMCHDFERRDNANSADVMEKSSGYELPSVCIMPANSINYNCYHPPSCEECMPQKRETIVRSISVSTESEPKLVAERQLPRLDGSGKYTHPNYFVMQATVAAEATTQTVIFSNEASKPTQSNFEQRMQKVLGTLHEKPCQVGEKPPLDLPKNYLNISMPKTSLPVAIITSSEPTEVDNRAAGYHFGGLPEKPNEVIRNQHLHRACYHPTPHTATDSKNAYQVEPPPQFHLITFPTLVATGLDRSKESQVLTKPLPATHLKIPWSPIRCPDSTCNREIFVSDFSRHMAFYHPKLLIERISPGQYKNFVLDPRVASLGTHKCHTMYLVRDKITDLGCTKFKDYLPILVMSTCVRLIDLCSSRKVSDTSDTSDDDIFLVIWLASIVPLEFPVHACLTVSTQSGRVPTRHMVHSGKIHSTRNPQELMDLCRSGQVMLLSETELQQLTRNGRDMMELQLIVH